MKDILIISHFLSTSIEKGNDRFTYLADMIKSRNEKFNVEIVTSSFSHDKKSQRDFSKYKDIDTKYKLTMLYETNYNKNISIKRFYSHFTLGRSLNKYLKTRKKPDIIYCAVPSLDIAYVASKYAKKNNIKFIIDIQDLWPEAFKMVFNIPVISNVVFKPMEILANSIYKEADEIVAVSDTYVNRALNVNSKVNNGKSVFLGTELSYFDNIKKNSKIEKNINEFWITYLGTLGHSYDLKIVMDALKIVKQKKIENIKFVIMGDGPLEEEFKKYAEKLDIDVNFTGRLEYENMVDYLSNSDIAVNPITKGAAQSIINKVGDYAAAGIPVLNTQECLEYRKLVDEYKCGINCKNNNAKDLSEKIIYLYNNKLLREKLGENNRKLSEDKFDRQKTYRKIVNIIEKI